MTRILGLKLTHDAAVTLIDNGRLVFHTEIEKLDNRARYSKMATGDIEEVLRREDIDPFSIDRVAIDGWKHGHINAPWSLDVASYHEHDEGKGNPRSVHFDVGPTMRQATSYSHNDCHIYAAYCTSPFAKQSKPAHVLVWDGGQVPRLYFVNPTPGGNGITFIGELHSLYGIIYGIMGYYFGPYKRPEVEAECRDALRRGLSPFPEFFGGYEIPGKLMSYIALGKLSGPLMARLWTIYIECGGFEPTTSGSSFKQDGMLEHSFMLAIRGEVRNAWPSLDDATVLRSIHEWLGSMLLSGLRNLIGSSSGPLIFTGGSALNIKWNSMLRYSSLFSSVWVPPFPNDCGNALGAACAEMVSRGEGWALDWSVYAGPILRPSNTPLEGWRSEPCSPERLGEVLHLSQAPAVFLNGRAEVGPRALGARSILASAASVAMRDWMNSIKKREDFRPVAPICLEGEAWRFFSPGWADPYMLFDHIVNPSRAKDIPAVVHLDGTARLQTINASQNAVMAGVLESYHKHSGIPVLCNTSANLNGSGFFPDAESAMRWGGCRFVWSDGVLFTKEST